MLSCCTYDPQYFAHGKNTRSEGLYFNSDALYFDEDDLSAVRGRRPSTAHKSFRGEIIQSGGI